MTTYAFLRFRGAWKHFSCAHAGPTELAHAHKIIVLLKAMQCWFPPFVLPGKDYRVGVDLFKVEVDAINQFLLGGDAATPQHAARHVKPWAVLGREDELESLAVET